MRKLILLALTLSICVSPAITAPNPPAVSIVQLISTPERFDGKAVTVVGFLMAHHERTILFLSAEDSQHYVLNNGVWLHPGAQMNEAIDKLDGKYVMVVGTFAAYRADSVHSSSGYIKDIRAVSRWSSSDESDHR